LSLQSLQQFVYTFITEPGELSSELRAQAEAVVQPNDRLSSVERLQIYRRMYLSRMEEALGCDYPLLREFLGASEFSSLVDRYVQAHPSGSYTLDRLGDSLCEFLRAEAAYGRRQTAVQDIARVEKAVVEVQEEREVAPLDAAELGGVPSECWGQLILEGIPALRLLQLNYPVHSWMAATRVGQGLPNARRRSTALLLWRQNYTLWRRPLEPRVARLLAGLLAGKPLQAAMEDAGRFSAARLFSTFQMWVQDGLFGGFRLANSALN
jgi:hypothetical protein